MQSYSQKHDYGESWSNCKLIGMHNSTMQPMRVHVVDDSAFAAPRGVQDEGFQGSCVVSRVVNFQGGCSPSSVDSSFEREVVASCWLAGWLLVVC